MVLHGHVSRGGVGKLEVVENVEIRIAGHGGHLDNGAHTGGDGSGGGQHRADAHERERLVGVHMGGRVLGEDAAGGIEELEFEP